MINTLLIIDKISFISFKAYYLIHYFGCRLWNMYNLNYTPTSLEVQCWREIVSGGTRSKKKVEYRWCKAHTGMPYRHCTTRFVICKYSLIFAPCPFPPVASIHFVISYAPLLGKYDSNFHVLLFHSVNGTQWSCCQPRSHVTSNTLNPTSTSTLSQISSCHSWLVTSDWWFSPKSLLVKSHTIFWSASVWLKLHSHSLLIVKCVKSFSNRRRFVCISAILSCL
jgi:hypothetical protein